MKRSKADVTPSELAEMVGLKEIDGLTHSQIANRFNLSPATVKQLLKGIKSRAEQDRQAEAKEFRDMIRRCADAGPGEPGEDLSRFVLPHGRKSDG